MNQIFEYRDTQASLNALIDELKSVRTELMSPVGTGATLQSHTVQTTSMKVRQTHDRLDPLEEQYNTIMDRIAALSRAPLPDPLDTFPEEIWEKIILEAGLTEFWPYETEISIEFILPLTLVSTRWRNAIVCNPRFWNTLLLASKNDDLEAKLYASIILSKDLPLTVIVEKSDDTNKLWESIGHHVVSQRSRIRSIVLCRGVQSDMILGSIGKVPLLESLRVDDEGAESILWLELIRSANSIQYIASSMSLSAETLRSESLHRLHTLEITQPTADIIRSLQLLSSAKVIDFNSHSSTFPLVDGCNSLRWKSFSYNGHMSEGLNSVLGATASTLVQLSLSPSWSEISALLLRCNDMPLLYELRLRMSDKSTSLEPQALNLKPSSIKELYITTPWRTDGTQANEEFLFRHLERLAPNVQILMFQSGVPAYSPFIKYASSLKPLKKLILGIENGNYTLESLQPQIEWSVGKTIHVETLSISKETYLDLIPVSGVLSFSHWVYYPAPPFLHVFKSSKWNKLQTISVSSGSSTNWKGISLPRVTKIEFREGRSLEGAAGLNALCEEIISSPQIFPSLQHLASSAIPDWDILFIMLERRNLPSPFNSPESISRIKVIEFRLLPSLRILKPLTALLGGRFTTRPSNRRLSLIGIAEAILDPNL
jgi:hypothetical protein